MPLKCEIVWREGYRVIMTIEAMSNVTQSAFSKSMHSHHDFPVCYTTEWEWGFKAIWGKLRMQRSLPQPLLLRTHLFCLQHPLSGDFLAFCLWSQQGGCYDVSRWHGSLLVGVISCRSSARPIPGTAEWRRLASLLTLWLKLWVRLLHSIAACQTGIQQHSPLPGIWAPCCKARVIQLNQLNPESKIWNDIWNMVFLKAIWKGGS